MGLAMGRRRFPWVPTIHSSLRVTLVLVAQGERAIRGVLPAGRGHSTLEGCHSKNDDMLHDAIP